MPSPDPDIRLRAVVLLLAFVLVGCGGPAAPEAPAPLPVELVTVKQAGGAGDGANFPARLAYDREVVLSPRVGGVIRAMPVAVGQRLAAGKLVVALDATPYRAALTRADADASRTARDAARDAALVGVGAAADADAMDAAAAAQAARAVQTAARYDLASARLTMPFAGVVLAKTTDVGATVAPGQPVVTVADLASPLIARAALTVDAARRVRRGDPADFTAAGKHYPGHVLRLGTVTDPASGTIEVDIALARSAGLASGTAGSAQCASRGLGGSATQGAGEQHIPAEALVDAHGQVGHVFLLDPRTHTARITALRLLGPGDDDLRVSGLPAGAQVITVGAGFVVDGQRVSVQSR